jgi:hypothetical protein
VDSITDLNATAKIRVLIAQRGLEIQFNIFIEIKITDGYLRSARNHNHHHHHQNQHQ